ncbi:hypothetical protein Tco_0308977, partial [Tanacetum coccineum]
NFKQCWNIAIVSTIGTGYFVQWLGLVQAFLTVGTSGNIATKCSFLQLRKLKAVSVGTIKTKYVRFQHGISNNAGTLAAIVGTIGTGYFVQWLGLFKAFLTVGTSGNIATKCSFLQLRKLKAVGVGTIKTKVNVCCVKYYSLELYGG